MIRNCLYIALIAVLTAGCDTMESEEVADQPRTGYEAVTINADGEFVSSSAQLIEISSTELTAGKTNKHPIDIRGRAEYKPGQIELVAHVSMLMNGSVEGSGRFLWDYFDRYYTAECIAGPLTHVPGVTFYAVVGRMNKPVQGWSHVGFTLTTEGYLSNTIVLSTAPTPGSCYWATNNKDQLPPLRGHMQVKIR